MKALQLAKQLGLALLLWLVVAVVFSGTAMAQTPPAAPEELWFHSRTRHELEISWKVSSDATMYRVYQWVDGQYQPLKEIPDANAAENAENAGISSDLRLVKLETLECGTSFQFVVGAINQYGESSSSPQLVTNTDECEPLFSPVQLSPLDGTLLTSNTNVYLKWRNGGQEPVDEYILQVLGPGNYEIVVHTDYLEWGLGKLLPGNYVWKVTAVRGDEQISSDLYDIHISYYMDPTLERPTLLFPKSTSVLTGGTAITVTWAYSLSDVQGTWVQVRSKEDNDFFLNTYVMSPTTHLAIGTLSEGSYGWMALLETNQYRSMWSHEGTFTLTTTLKEVEPTTITNPISGTVVVTNQAFLLEWVNVNANGYNVEVEGPEGLLQTGRVTGTSTILQLGLPGTYLVKVQSVLNNNLSEWSDKVLVFVDAPLEPVINCDTWGNLTVTVFDQVNCTGSGRELPLGLTNMTDIGMERLVSSIYIPHGMSIRVYESANAQGRTKCYSDKSMWNLALDKWWEEEQVVGNSISSVEVFQNSSCSPFNITMALPLLSRN